MIHDTISYDHTLEIVEAMFGFEDRYTPDHEKKEPPLSLKDRLRSLCESANWSASDLVRFLGLDATMGTGSWTENES